ncbi:MAG: ABC transporter ATP-binding protein [Pseudohongiellaceae bacterium]
MTTVALSAKNLEVKRGAKTVLAGISFDIPKGEVFVLLGGNGAGKSTTLLTFMGLLRPRSGEALVFGVSSSDDPVSVRKEIAFLPESAALYDHLTGWENLEYFMSLDPSPKGSRPSRAALDDVLDTVSLPAEARAQPLSSYSKGMRQKVAIALALLRKTPVLLLDEPTSGLDPIAVEDFHRILEHLSSQGVTTFMVTHDLHGACQVADRIGLLKAGKLVGGIDAEPDGPIDILAVRSLLAGKEAA